MVKELALSEIMEICGPAESVVLHAGEFLFQEGDEAHALYVVKKGVLRPQRRDGMCSNRMAGIASPSNLRGRK
jgi:hypothetical protein